MKNAAPDLRTEVLLREMTWLRRLAGALVNDAALADDLAHDALLAALRRRTGQVARPRAWLAAIVMNCARRSGLARERRELRERACAAAEAVPATDEVVAHADLLAEIANAVRGLGEPYRTAVLLRYFEDLKPRAIARRLELPVETVKTRIRRGVELVRVRLVESRRGSSGSAGLQALLPLLDSSTCAALLRSLAGKAGVATSKAAGFAAGSGLVGVTLMSAKLKIGAAIGIAILGAALAIYVGGDRRDRAAADGTAILGPGPSSSGTATVAELPAAPAPAEATRLAEPAVAADLAANASPPDPASGCVIEGIVRTPDATLANGALVAVAIVKTGGVFSSAIDVARGAHWFSNPTIAPEDGCRVQTGEDGRFRIERLAGGSTVDVAAVHPDVGLAFASAVVPGTPDAPLHLELMLHRGVVLTGAVRNPSNSPIEDAHIHVTGHEGGSHWGLLALSTDGNGEYRSLPMPFWEFSLSVSARGFIAMGSEVAASEGDRTLCTDFTLERSIAMAGRITASSGGTAGLRGYPGELEIFGSAEDPERPSPLRLSWRRGEVRRDEDRYELEFDDRSLRFVSLWTGSVLLGSAPIEDPATAPDLPCDTTLLARRAQSQECRMTLEVFDEATGAPVTDYSLSLARTASHILMQEQPRGAGAIHAPEGSFTVGELDRGEYEVSVSAETFAPRVVRATLTADSPAARVPIGLRRADQRIQGRVVDENGRPIAQVPLALCAAEGGYSLPQWAATTISGGDGAFRFESIPLGDWCIVARAAERAPAVVRARAGDEHVVVTVRPGIEVTLDLARLGKAFEGWYDYQVSDESGAPVHELSGFNGGAVRDIRLEPGRYVIDVYAAGHRRATVPFTAADGARVPIDLVPLTEE